MSTYAGRVSIGSESTLESTLGLIEGHPKRRVFEPQLGPGNNGGNSCSLPLLDPFPNVRPPFRVA
jgi:hypothetical protein